MRLSKRDRDALDDLRAALSATSSPQEAAYRSGKRIADRVDADGFCFMLTDPATGVPLDVVGSGDGRIPKTSAYFDSVYGRSRAVDYRARAAEPHRVHRLEEILGPGWRDDRYAREMMFAFGYEREIQVSFAASSKIWGYLSLHRRTGAAEFDRRADRFLGAAAPLVAGALRQMSAAQLLGTVPATSEAIVTLAPDGTIEALTGFARELLETRAYEGISFGISAMASMLRQAMKSGEPFEPRSLPSVDTVTGQRFQIHAEMLRGADGRARGVVFARALRGFDDLRSLEHLGLTQREAEITLAAARGYTTKEIAATLALSPYTVESHIKAVFEKLGVSSRPELAAIVFGG